MWYPKDVINLDTALQPMQPRTIAELLILLIAVDRPSKFRDLHLLDPSGCASPQGERFRKSIRSTSTTCMISQVDDCSPTHVKDSNIVASARQELIGPISMSTPNPASSSQYRLHLSPLPPPPTLPPAEILKFFSRFGTPTEFYRPGLDGLGQERDYGFLGMDFGEKGEKGLSRCESLRHISALSRYELSRFWVGLKTDYIITILSCCFLSSLLSSYLSSSPHQSMRCTGISMTSSSVWRGIKLKVSLAKPDYLVR